MPSAFATAGAQAFDSIPYIQRCAANRSASMDSDISSCSPFHIAKRHCPSQPQAPLSPAAAQSRHHWQQAQQQHHINIAHEPHSTQQFGSLDAQKLHALKAMLQQGSAPQPALLLAYLQQLQRLHQSASQIRSAQQCLAEHSDLVQHLAQALQPRQHFFGKQQAQCQQTSHLAQQHQQAVLMQRQYSSLNDAVHYAQCLQTPEHPEEPRSSASDYFQPAYDAPSDAPAQFESVQQLPTTFQKACQHQACYVPQPVCPAERAWRATQALVALPAVHKRQTATSSATPMLHMQQQARLEQLAQLTQARLQQQQAAQQQAERQFVRGPRIRSALSFPDLVAYWAKGLSLQRCESVHLACHLWKRVQQQVRG